MSKSAKQHIKPASGSNPAAPPKVPKISAASKRDVHSNLGKHLSATAKSLGMLPMSGDLFVPGAQDNHATNCQLLSEHESQLLNLATVIFSTGNRGVSMSDKQLIRQHLYKIAGTVGHLWANPRSERMRRELWTELGLQHHSTTGHGDQAWCPEWQDMMNGMWSRHYGRNYETTQTRLLEAIPMFTDASVKYLTLYQHVSTTVEYALSAGKSEKDVKDVVLRKTSGNQKTTVEQLFDQGKSVSEVLRTLEMRCEARIAAAQLRLKQSMGHGGILEYGGSISSLQFSGQNSGKPAANAMDQPCPDHFNEITQTPATHSYRDCRRRIRMEAKARGGNNNGSSGNYKGKHGNNKRQGNGQGGGPSKKVKTADREAKSDDFTGICKLCDEVGHRAADCSAAKELIKREQANKKKAGGSISLAVASSDTDSPAPYMSPASFEAFAAQLDADIAASAPLTAAIAAASTANTETAATAEIMDCDEPLASDLDLFKFAGVAERDTSAWD